MRSRRILTKRLFAKSAKTYRFEKKDSDIPVRLADYKLVCLLYIPPGKHDEIEIHLDAEDFPSDKHHYPPSSRRGQTITNIHPILHWSWHVLFGNDLVEEVVAKIIYVWQDKVGQIKELYLLGKVKPDEFGIKYDVRYLAWYTIFGETRDVQEAIKIIEETFIKRT